MCFCVIAVALFSECVCERDNKTIISAHLKKDADFWLAGNTESFKALTFEFVFLGGMYAVGKEASLI